MLGVSSYPAAYIEACRKRFEAEVDAYERLAGVAGKGAAAAMEAFAPGYFGSLVLALDHCFMHRLRTKEGKDGNPLNEVRMLSDSIMENAGVLAANSTIKYAAAKSVAGIAVGDKIRLDASSFRLLASRFLDEIGQRFP